MSGIIPLGFGRVSQPMLAGMGIGSTQSQMARLSQLEQQIMTQQRYQYGSDSPYNASTTVTVQMLMERKQQVTVNLTATQSFLSASDSSLSQVNNLTTDARSNALDALNTTTSATTRSALAEQVKQITQKIFELGNTKYLDRYLFSGSQTTSIPFVWGNGSNTIKYTGNETGLNTWGDVNIVSQSNVNGVDTFGAISEAIRGTTDLNPVLKPETLLSTLNGGNGVTLGKIRMTFETATGTTTADVDLSRCATVDDVRKALSKNSPMGASVNVELTNNALKIGLSSTTPGTLGISEIGKGQTAHSLGIYTKTPIPSGSYLTGADLNPKLTVTTRLDDICGSRAQTYLHFAGDNNDLIVQAKANGETITDPETGKTWEMNGVEVVLISNSNVTPGRETAVYDEANKRIIVNTHPDLTTAQGIADAVNNASAAGTIPPFEAVLDSVDQTSGRAGQGLVPLVPGTPAVFAKTAYGAGTQFDRSGMQIVNDNAVHLIDFSEDATIGDMLNALNDDAVGLSASINKNGTGIDVRTRVSGADFEIGENGGNTATQLGIRTCMPGTKLSELDYGRGVTDYDGPGVNATAVYSSKSANSALFVTAKEEGTAGNDYKINFIPTADPDGRVLVSWDKDAKVINIGINPGVTKACEIVAAFNEQVGPRDLFEMKLDDSGGTNTGEGVVYEGNTVTSGGVNGGVDFTITRNDGVTFEVDIKGAKTIQDVIDIINKHPDNTSQLLTARLAKNGNGIELVDSSIGNCQTRVDRTLLGTAAISLGLVNEGEEYRIATNPGSRAMVNYDSGVINGNLLVTAKNAGDHANDVKIVFVDNVASGNPNSTGFHWDSVTKTMTFEIDPGVTTANDIIKLFENDATPEVRAMFDFQNGLNNDGSISNGSGLVALTPPDNPPVMSGGENSSLQGNDPNPQEADSLFNALLRLQTAMSKNDEREIERASKLLDTAIDRVLFTRNDIGIRQNGLDTISARLADENVQLNETLRASFQIDESSTIINYSNEMVAYEASLKVTSQMFQLSLINYI
ncbi:MAG: hypothetical protein FWC50_01970 [Planctomycetaceae bacterium]|nr:hypothetical protein [Planctomycetaceae bacterium]